MTIKELQNNEELIKNIVEDIDEIPEDSEVSYEVWVIGYDADDAVTDVEVLVDEFENINAAVARAQELTLTEIKELCKDCSEFDEVAYISIEVETVAEDEDGEFFNIGTTYNRELWIGVPDPEEDEDYPEDQIVYLEAGEYEVLEDNTLKVNCFALKGFNKNDIVMFYFPKEEFPMEYKIMSRVMYEDGDYYHCELTY
jgi:hypothetical protein